MTEFSYKCKYCGEIVNGAQRAVHAQKHHPAVPIAKLDIFVGIDFIKVNDSSRYDITGKASINDIHSNYAGRDNNTIVVPKNESKLSQNKNKNSASHRLSFGNQLDGVKIKQEQHTISDPNIPNTQNFKPENVPYEPKSHQAKDLFEYAVKRIAQKFQTDKNILSAKTHQEWMNICFDRRFVSTPLREEYMSRIKATYAEYFKKGAGRKYTFDFVKIARDYPHYFAFGKSKTPVRKGLDGMIEAMKVELNLSKQPDKREKFKVSGIETIDTTKRLYGLRIDLDDSKTISFNESQNASLRIEESWYNCDCIDFNEEESVLYVVTNRRIYGYQGMLYIDTTFILEKIVERLQNVKSNGLSQIQPANKFIKGISSSLTTISSSHGGDYADIIDQMDRSQRSAIDATIKHDISFIWGPPGTGKSFTLAGLINIFAQREEATLVCCISNVAVDQLLNKVIDKIEELNYRPFNCEFMRAGYTIDSRLLSIDCLFPRDTKTDSLRRKIRQINDRLSAFSRHKATRAQIEQELHLKEERIKLREELKKHTELIVDKSRIVFSTMANYILSPQLENKKFDNLIVDEASMLSMPYLIALSSNVFKRVILVGDPNQLGPISLTPEDMLSKSVFDHCKVLDDSHPHPALSRLLVQRRSHRSIVNLINNFFYEGKLSAVVDYSPEWVIEGPFPDKVVKVINKGIEDDAVKMIGTSRRNLGTHAEVMAILEEFYDSHIYNGYDFFIGVITPFRAQVKMYKAAFRERYNNDGFWESIKVGTVHTFQGSECDMIIFDLVEKQPEKVSKLFNEKEGERLVNVALSRARHKLIIVGDTKRFLGGSGLATVSPTTCKALGQLRDITTTK